MSLGSRPGLFAILAGGLALAIFGCNSTGATAGTGAFGAGAGQLAGTCQAVAARLSECGLPETSLCSNACEAECVEAASCSELDALFAGHTPTGSLGACLQACTGSGSTGTTGCEGDSDCASGEYCNDNGQCTSIGGGSGGSDGGSGSSGGGSGGSGSSGNSSSGSGNGSSSSSSGGSGSSSSGGLAHPECQSYADAICGTCHGANPCGTGSCEDCAASTCDEIYDQCSAWLNCQASTCGSSSCCGMPCSPC